MNKEFVFLNKDDFRDDTFIIRNFLTDSECDELVQKCEGIGFGDAPINTFAGPVVNKSMRDNERVMIDDEELAKSLWHSLWPFVPERSSRKAIGLNERFRFYRYGVGQFFDWHFDGPFERNPSEASMLTVLIYLNGDYTGGTTDLNFKLGTIRDEDPVITVTPEKGMAFIFNHNILHRGAPVLTGRKYVLRTDVMYKSDFDS